MSKVKNTDPVVTESKLTEFYEDIKPFLGCPAYLTSEGNAEYYSTDEKVIGRWVDGKPLYQKTFAPSTVYNAGTHNIATGITNIDKMVEIKGVQINNNTGDTFAIDENSNDYIGYIGGKIVYTKTSTGVTWKIIVSIKYTKTTDSAATTIQSDPNEYSTDEKIIGKWIDGKPIYQKTATGTLDSTGFDNSIIITNVDEVIDIKGIVNQPSGTGGINKIPLNFINLTGEYHTGAFFRKRINSIDVECTSQYAGFDYVVTMQYTKTTD